MSIHSLVAGGGMKCIKKKNEIMINQWQLFVIWCGAQIKQPVRWFGAGAEAWVANKWQGKKRSTKSRFFMYCFVRGWSPATLKLYKKQYNSFFSFHCLLFIREKALKCERRATIIMWLIVVSACPLLAFVCTSTNQPASQCSRDQMPGRWAAEETTPNRIIKNGK